MPELEPLYSAAEMRTAEERYAGSVEELMERAGIATARVALEQHSGFSVQALGRGSRFAHEVGHQ